MFVRNNPLSLIDAVGLSVVDDLCSGETVVITFPDGEVIEIDPCDDSYDAPENPPSEAPWYVLICFEVAARQADAANKKLNCCSGGITLLDIWVEEKGGLFGGETTYVCNWSGEKNCDGVVTEWGDSFSATFPEPLPRLPTRLHPGLPEKDW